MDQTGFTYQLQFPDVGGYILKNPTVYRKYAKSIPG